MEEKERPWLKDVTFTPAARDPEPGATRLRPLIYVCVCETLAGAVELLLFALTRCAAAMLQLRAATYFQQHDAAVPR